MNDDTWDESELPTPEELAASEALFANLADGVAITPDPAAELLRALREDLDERASRSPVISLNRARWRSRRARHIAVASVVVAGVAFSSTGVAAAALSSQPGDLLYGVRTAISGPIDDSNRKLAASIVNRTQALRTSVDAGGPSATAARSQAAADLAAAAALVPKVKDPGRRKRLVKEVELTRAQLGLPPVPIPTVAPTPEASPSPDPNLSPTPSQSRSPSQSPSPSPSTTPSPKKHPKPKKTPKPTKTPRPTKTPKTPSPTPTLTPTGTPRLTPASPTASARIVRHTPSPSSTSASPTPSPQSSASSP